MANLSGLREELRTALKHGVEWLATVRDSGVSSSQSFHSDIGEHIQTVDELRSRASSALLTVGFLGGFSSGKSFLLSGLQGSLELKELASGAEVAHQYVGLLPSAPTPTTACPVSVVPVSDRRGDRGFLRVRFADADEWEKIGDVTSPLQVAGYVMGQSNYVMGRLEEHWNREVAEVEIEISQHRLLARLYDLPGHGSAKGREEVNSVHEAIVRTKMQDADAYIYVANATASLGEVDLQMIHFLYDHHKISKKPVIWVVTAIDRALDLGLRNRPGWQDTVEQNNKYLEENFLLHDGTPDMGFIGRGFVPVSPALEAQGNLEIESSEDRRTLRGRGLIAQSHMDELRDILNDMISNETGAKHIALVAAKALIVLEPHQLMLTNLLDAERLPVEQLNSSREDLATRWQIVDSAISAATDSLRGNLTRRIRVAERPFSEKHSLASQLHDGLDSLINEADVRKPSAANKIAVQQTQIIQKWLYGPTGPDSIWRQEFASFTEDALDYVRKVLQRSASFGELGGVRQLQAQELAVSPPGRSGKEIQDVVQVAAGVAGAIAPIAGTIAAALGVATGGLLFIPVGITVGAAVLYGAIAYRKKNDTSLDVERREWISHLDGVAEEIRRRFVSHNSLIGSEVIARAVQVLGERRDQLVQSILITEQRMANPETIYHQEAASRLEPICKRGSEITASLRALMANDVGK